MICANYSLTVMTNSPANVINVHLMMKPQATLHLSIHHLLLNYMFTTLIKTLQDEIQASPPHSYPGPGC
jgi:hypothetical protein